MSPHWLAQSHLGIVLPAPPPAPPQPRAPHAPAMSDTAVDTSAEICAKVSPGARLASRCSSPLCLYFYLFFFFFFPPRTNVRFSFRLFNFFFLNLIFFFFLAIYLFSAPALRVPRFGADLPPLCAAARSCPRRVPLSPACGKRARGPRRAGAVPRRGVAKGRWGGGERAALDSFCWQWGLTAPAKLGLLVGGFSLFFFLEGWGG